MTTTSNKNLRRTRTENTVEQRSRWNGRPLPDDPVAVILLPQPADGMCDFSPVLFVTTPDAHEVHVTREQLADFLTLHAKRTLVCENAALLHWGLIDVVKSSDRDVVDILWNFAKECRLRDVTLMDQRLRIIVEGVNPLPRGLPDLIRRYVGDDIAGLSNASRLLSLYAVLRPQFDRLVSEVDPQLVEQFGPLGLGVDVQGAIAAEAMNRHGIRLDRNRLIAFHAEWEGIFNEASAVLRESEAACGQLRWFGKVVKRDSHGYLDVKTKRLRDWLQLIFNNLVSVHGVPFSPPLDDRGELSTRLSDWGALPKCHDHLEAWHQLAAAASMAQMISAASDDCHVQFEIMPRLQPVRPELCGIRDLNARIFAPRPGQSFLICSLERLELRCLAAVCNIRCRRPGVQLADSFCNGHDPIVDTVQRLLEIAADSDLPQYRSKWFCSLDQGKQLALVKVLLFGVSRLLHPASVLRLVERRLDGHEVPLGEVQQLMNLLTRTLYSEFEVFLTNPVLEAVSRARNVPLEQVYEDVFRDLPADQYRSTMLSLMRERKDDLQDVPRGFTGRIGRRMLAMDVRAAEIAEVKDEVMKTVLFEVTAAGFHLAGTADDEFVVEVAACETMENQITSVVNVAAAKVLGPIAREICRCRPANVW